MKKTKTPLLRDVLRARQKASYLIHHPHTYLQELQTTYREKAYNRRRFLKDMGKVALGAGILPSLLSSCGRGGTSYLQKTQGTSAEIVIIGAGIAGLTCLHTLAKAGVKANVYEASSRIGGRMYTRREVFGTGLNTEFGGEFIDTINTDMLSLISEFGLETVDAHQEFATSTLVKDTYFFNNRHYTEDEVIEAFRPVSAKMEADALSCGDDYDTPDCIRLDNTPLEAYIEGLDCETWLKELLLYAYLAEYGLEGGEQSALNLIDFIGKDTSDGFKIFGESDEKYKIIGGNATLPERMGEKYSSLIHTGYHLEAIRSSGTGYQLSFQNGREVLADIVVMTLPFSILRNIDMKIDGFPDEKRKCIDALGYGLNNKLMVGTRSRPWRENGYAGYVYNDKIYTGWDNAHMQGNNRGPAGYTLYLSGNQALEAGQRVRGIDKVEDQLTMTYLDQLDKIFPGSKQAYTGTHYAALWTNNPYVRGSYSCYRTGQWTTIAGMEGEPVGQLYFAGEHCSEEFQGFMNGGAETGRKTAETILSKHIVR